MDIKNNEQAFLENGDLIRLILEVKETLEDLQKWNAADGTPDIEADRCIEEALQDVNSLYRRLVDLQINLLTFA